MPYIPNKNDLLKLKESKGVPILAHSHETVVPVVYSTLVNNFLKSKGIKLPLTHHQLHEFKEKAKHLKGHPELEAFARGGKITIKPDNSIMKHEQKVVVNVNTGAKTRRRKRAPRSGKVSKGISQPMDVKPVSNLYSSLRPNNYAMIRPHMMSGFTQPAIIPDYKREADEHLKRERETLAKYKKELDEKKVDPIKELAEKRRDIAFDKAPLIAPDYVLIPDPVLKVEEPILKAEEIVVEESKEDVASSSDEEPKVKQKTQKPVKAGFVLYDQLPKSKRFIITSDDPKVVIIPMYYNAGSSGAANPVSFYQMGYNLNKKGEIKSYKLYKENGKDENYANYVNADLRPRFQQICNEHAGIVV